MEANSQTVARINEAVDGILKMYPTGKDAGDYVMTDLCFQVKPDTGELCVLNDDDEVVSSVIVDDWIDNHDDGFEDSVAAVLREVLTSRKQEIEPLPLLKPYSFFMVDADRETVTELYLVDDNSIVVGSGELMEGLDKDLDAFMERLLPDE